MFCRQQKRQIGLMATKTVNTSAKINFISIASLLHQVLRLHSIISHFTCSTAKFHVSRVDFYIYMTCLAGNLEDIINNTTHILRPVHKGMYCKHDR